MASFFPEVKGRVPFEGPGSRNPLSFKYYDADRLVGDKTLEEHLRFSMAFWHTLRGTGSDPFGEGTFRRSWDQADEPMERARCALQAGFEFCTKLGLPFYCFHDRDIAPEGETFDASCRNLDAMVELATKLQSDTGVKLLWGTANLFSHPRYANGAATNPDPHVLAYAAAQVRHAIDATQALGGENYVFWGGREGYETLLNTDMKQEQEQLARFLHMAVDYARRSGFEGQFLIEPKPKEPTKHQYDTDASTVLAFLRQYDLWDAFKLNVEANHATLAGHSFEHDLAVAAMHGKLGSVDANRGDLLLGWDTDQFPADVAETTAAMLIILKQGGLGKGGLNFDAKVRRASVDGLDLFYAHINGMDAFARGLLVAHEILQDGILDARRRERYAGFREGMGSAVMAGDASFESLEAWVREAGEPTPRSGRQEMLEGIFGSYL